MFKNQAKMLLNSPEQQQHLGYYNDRVVQVQNT